MKVTLQYFDGCPNWTTTADHLSRLCEEGSDIVVEHELIESHEMAIEKGFAGSPTVLIGGVDPFAEGDAPAGLSCRIYQTKQGPAGSPTLEQLREAVRGPDQG